MSVDLSTRYLNLDLAHPIVNGAGPLADDLDGARRLEDEGAAAIVLRSLFEEQIAHDEVGGALVARSGTALAPGPAFRLGPHEYLELLRRIKAAVRVPVIASINGTTPGGWLEYARWIEAAGADALELNTYRLVTDPLECANAVEERVLEVVRAVRAQVSIPIAAKLSPFHTAMAHFALAVERAGADGLVLFNRFYHPDIDLTAQRVVPTMHLSDPSELGLRVRWLAALSATMRCSLACTGGVHGPDDAVKAILAGAHVVQMTSALLMHGPGRLRVVLDGLRRWLDEREVTSLAEVRGSLNLARCPNPQAFERANYVHALHRAPS